MNRYVILSIITFDKESPVHVSCFNCRFRDEGCLSLLGLCGFVLRLEEHSILSVLLKK